MSEEENPEIAEVSKELKKYIIKQEDYKIIRPIGKGGMAEVYLAKDKKSGENVAYKQLFTSLQPKQLKQFAREVSTMASVNHPFLLKFYGFSPTPPLVLVSEYIPNGSLFAYIHSETGKKKLTGSNRTVISMAIAHAMAKLHEIGIIHRDLKSLNVLLDKEFLPRLGDFGIARYLNGDEPMTMRLGTPHWMAPETLKGDKNYGPKVDVYSFGMLLYELLTNLIPWEGKDPLWVAHTVVHKNRPELPEDGPEALCDLIRVCWSQKPSKRPTFVEIYNMFKNREVEFEGTNDDAVRWLSKKLENFEKENKKKERIKNANKKKKSQKSDSDYSSDESKSDDDDEEEKSDRIKKKSKNLDEVDSKKKSKITKKSKMSDSEHYDYDESSYSEERVKKKKKEVVDEKAKKNSKRSNAVNKRKRREYSESDSYDEERIPSKRAKSVRSPNLKNRAGFDTDDICTRNAKRNKNLDDDYREEIPKKKKKQNTYDNIYQEKKSVKKRIENSNSDDEYDEDSNKRFRNKNRQIHLEKNKKKILPSNSFGENDIKDFAQRKKSRYSDIPQSILEPSSKNRNLKTCDFSRKKPKSVLSDDKNDFQKINEQFRQIIASNTPLTKKATILRQISHNIINDRSYVQIFIANDFHHRLPLCIPSKRANLSDPKSIQSAQLNDACFDVFLALFTVVPEQFQVNFEDTMKSLIQISPEKSIILLSVFSMRFSQLENPWPLLDLMLDESSLFLSNKSGPMLVMTLYYLCINSKSFKESRLADCVVVFLDGIRSRNIKTIKSSYNALCVFYDGDEEVDFESVCEHIRDKRIQENSLNFLLRLEKIPIKENLICCLLEEARNNEKATLCLIKIAQTKEGAISIIETETKWISEPLPTTEKTMQLFLSIIKYPEIAKYIMNIGKKIDLFDNSTPLFDITTDLSLRKSTNVSYSGRFDLNEDSDISIDKNKANSKVYYYIMQLYLLVCSAKNSNLLRAAAASIEAFSNFYNGHYNSNSFDYSGINNTITLEFLAQLQKSKALMKMLKLALALNDDISIKSGLIIIGILSDVDYAKEYVIFAEKIANIINENSDKSLFAVHLAVKLSKFDLCAKEFNDLKLRDFFVNLLKSKQFREEAEYFIKNIDKFTQYY